MRSRISTGSSSVAARYAIGVTDSSSPGVGSSDTSPPEIRVSISSTSSGFTPSSLAIAFASERVSDADERFMLRRLKNSLRCAFVVAILTSRQLRSTCSWISALIQ